jgi:hypothetical protein
MESSVFEMPDAEAFGHSFRAALDAMPQPVFAIIDGGRFDDIEDELSDAGIDSRSLYLKGGDAAMRRDGPWLVALREIDKRKQHLVKLALEKPCAVFWSCPEGEDALWRHLRTINRVRIADRRPKSKPEGFEWVLFRHADPSVLAQTLPAFERAHFARFFGPATSVLFFPEEEYLGRPGWLRARRAEALPAPPRGPLTLDHAALVRIEQRRADAIRYGIVSHLKETAPQDFGPLSDERIEAAVTRSEASALELKIRTAENRRKWAWLDLASDGNFSRSRPVREHLTRPNADHDWDMDALIALAKKEMRREAR